MDDLSKKLIDELPRAKRPANPHWVDGTRWIDDRTPLIPSIGKVEIGIGGTKSLFYIAGNYGKDIVVSNSIIRNSMGDFLIYPVNLDILEINSYSPLN